MVRGLGESARDWGLNAPGLDAELRCWEGWASAKELQSKCSEQVGSSDAERPDGETHCNCPRNTVLVGGMSSFPDMACGC